MFLHHQFCSLSFHHEVKYNTSFTFYNEGNGYIPSTCREHIVWAHEYGKHDPHANDWYSDMKKITGVEPSDASFYDFQRLYRCNGNRKNECIDKGLEFPLLCSYPPCDQCVFNNTGTFSNFN